MPAFSAFLRSSTLVQQYWQYRILLHHAQTVPGLRCVSRHRKRSWMVVSKLRYGHNSLGDVLNDAEG